MERRYEERTGLKQETYKGYEIKFRDVITYNNSIKIEPEIDGYLQGVNFKTKKEAFEYSKKLIDKDIKENGKKIY